MQYSTFDLIFAQKILAAVVVVATTRSLTAVSIPTGIRNVRIDLGGMLLPVTVSVSTVMFVVMTTPKTLGVLMALWVVSCVAYSCTNVTNVGARVEYLWVSLVSALISHLAVPHGFIRLGLAFSLGSLAIAVGSDLAYLRRLMATNRICVLGGRGSKDAVVCSGLVSMLIC